MGPAKATPITEDPTVDIAITLTPIPPATFPPLPTGTITIFDTFDGMTVVIGVLTVPANSSLPDLADGTHVISAIYSCDENYSSSVSVSSLLVLVDDTPTSLSITLPVEVNTVSAAEPGSALLLVAGLMGFAALRRRNADPTPIRAPEK
jgi:hypothetical protein